MGGAGAECASDSSLATPRPRPRATCAPPCQPHPSWGTTEPGVRAGCAQRHSPEFCFCLDRFPGPGNVASLRALRLWTRERVCGANLWVESWSTLRQHDQPGRRSEQGNRLSESRSSKTGKRNTRLRPAPVRSGHRRVWSPVGSKVKGSEWPLQLLWSRWSRGGWAGGRAIRKS